MGGARLPTFYSLGPVGRGMFQTAQAPSLPSHPTLLQRCGEFANKVSICCRVTGSGSVCTSVGGPQG